MAIKRSHSYIPSFPFPDSQLTRKAPASYADGVYTMNGGNRPSPRTLSQAFMKGEDGLSSIKNRTAMLTFFGKTICSRSS